jgi:hypothetical protein
MLIVLVEHGQADCIRVLLCLVPEACKGGSSITKAGIAAGRQNVRRARQC